MKFQTVLKCLAAFALLVTMMNAIEFAIAERSSPGPTGRTALGIGEPTCCMSCGPLSSALTYCESGQTCSDSVDGGIGNAACIDPAA